MHTIFILKLMFCQDIISRIFVWLLLALRTSYPTYPGSTPPLILGYVWWYTLTWVHWISWGLCPMPLSRHFHNSASSAGPPFFLHEIAAPVANPSYRCRRFIFTSVFKWYEGLYAGLFTLGFGISWIGCRWVGGSAWGGVGLSRCFGGVRKIGFPAFGTTSIAT